MNTPNLSQKTADWRGTLLKNRRRTHFIIAAYFLLYAALGILIDSCIIPNMGKRVVYYYQGHQLPRSLVCLSDFTPTCTYILLVVAVVSLFFSFLFHDRLMLLGTTYRRITANTARNIAEKQLYNVVEEMKIAAGLAFLPKIYLVDAPHMNAFASGYSGRSAFVAITRGLFEKLDRDELQAVMAHELSHIHNMDIKVTLTASVLSNLILIVVDCLFYGVFYGNQGRRERLDPRLFILIVILRYALPLVTMMLMIFLSRSREYMADAGSVSLLRDNAPLARALLKIDEDHKKYLELMRFEYGKTPHENVRRAAYIYDPVTAGANPVFSLSSLFSTHPSLEDRLKAIGYVPPQHNT